MFASTQVVVVDVVVLLSYTRTIIIEILPVGSIGRSCDSSQISPLISEVPTHLVSYYNAAQCYHCIPLHLEHDFTRIEILFHFLMVSQITLCDNSNFLLYLDGKASS